MVRSRGWLTSKIHAVVDGSGVPVRFALGLLPIDWFELSE
jgi:hypothetical protein